MVRRYVVFRGGPKDGAIAPHPTAEPFPYTLQFPVFLRPVVWPDPHPDLGPQFGLCIYRLSGETQFRDKHGGGIVGTYEWRPPRPAGDRPPMGEPTVAELARLTRAMAQHPDLKGPW